ncbi:hypothetical protein [Olivibacter domesticus]|uniref:Uncharacterized protein n=1 Tax=Olivibacter domesticus TaxID=407022 RepID=A0A1H7GRV6_OLID1|nr:hypothetical protein [Olivibacter domesticus]SEK40764.1 hypothetical protein SAMN05661044_00170 [Olivibacter domesticus]
MEPNNNLYVVKFISPIRAVVFMVLWCGISIVGLFASYEWLISEELIPSSTWTGGVLLCFATCLIGIGYLLTWKVALGIVALRVDGEGMKWSWHRRYYLSLAKNRGVRWEEIDNYVFQPDYRYEQLKLRLRSGKTIRWYHSYEQKGDDYSLFVFGFKDQIAQRALQSNADVRPIAIGKTFYETKLAMVLLILLVAVCLVFLAASLFIAKKRVMSFGILTLMGSGMSYYAYHVIQAHRKKRSGVAHKIKR